MFFFFSESSAGKLKEFLKHFRSADDILISKTAQEFKENTYSLTSIGYKMNKIKTENNILLLMYQAMPLTLIVYAFEDRSIDFFTSRAIDRYVNVMGVKMSCELH